MTENETITDTQLAQSVEKIIQARDEAKVLKEKEHTVSYLGMMLKIPLRLFYNIIEVFTIFMIYYAYIKITATPMMSKFDITYDAIGLFIIATLFHLFVFIGKNSFQNNLKGFFALLTYLALLQISWFYFLANLIYSFESKQ